MSVRRGLWVVALLAVFGVATMFAAWNLRGAARRGAPAVLVFDAPAALSETAAVSFPLALRFARRSGLTVHEIVAALARAARDPGVGAIHLRVSRLDWGWAKLSEVRDALQAFAATGKPVIATIEGGGDAEYFLASAATTLTAPPSAVLQIDGLALSAIFYADLLSKLDVRPNFARAGRFKSGIEPYTRSNMSESARIALDALLDDQFRLFVDSLATARRLDPEDVRKLVDSGPFDAGEAMNLGLLDTLLHVTDAEALARRGQEKSERVTLREYSSRSIRRGGPRVALIVASGTIVSGRSRFTSDGEEGFGVESLREAIREARDHGARAIVLRIDSPGGSYQAAEDMWREIRRCASEIPVIASMSDLAASGGYLIAAPATRIVAQPASITGSIGIYGGKLNVSGLYRKIGLEIETLHRGARAGMMSPFRDFSADEAEHFQRQLERNYRSMLAQVADARGFSLELADTLGQGRIWSGQAAFTHDLVDTLGGLEVAVALAVREAGLSDDEPFTLDVFPRPRLGWLERIVASWFDESAGGEVAFPWADLPVPHLDAWRHGAPLALLPFEIDVR